MANLEKHPKHAMEQIDLADFSAVPTCGRASHLIGQYIKNRQSDGRSRSPGVDDRMRAVILRLEDTPATPGNLERLRERVRLLNQRLADSGTPIRLRMV